MVANLVGGVLSFLPNLLGADSSYNSSEQYANSRALQQLDYNNTVKLMSLQNKYYRENYDINDKMYRDNLLFNNDIYKDNYKYLNLNGYSLMRQGLINAGYNPLLAVNASPVNGQLASTSYGNSYAPDMQANTSSSISSSRGHTDARSIGLQRMNDAQLRNTDANTALQVSQAQTEAFRQSNIASNTRLQNAESVLKSKEASWYDKKIASEILSNSQQANLFDSQSNAIRSKLQLEKDLLNSQVELNKFEKANKTANTVLGAVGVLGGTALGTFAGLKGRFNQAYKRSKVGFHSY